MKIVIINHTFQLRYFYRRWELFAEQYNDVDVYLLAPDKLEWYKKGYTFGKSQIIEGKTIERSRFHIRLFNQVYLPFFGWYSPAFKGIIEEIGPDIVYYIGGHNELAFIQILRLARRINSKTKVIGFSMRGPQHNIRIKPSNGKMSEWIRQRLMYLYEMAKKAYVNRHCDAFFCHYPDAVKAFRDEGYKGPIYMQTQVGVNREWFYEDFSKRQKIRNKFGISDDTYVFGSATRFSPDKGLDVILNALPINGNWKFFMIGGGTEDQENHIRELIKERGVEDNVILPGVIDRFEMSDFWNAIDCAVHVPLTREWVETFSLSVIQPMIMNKPIIGDTSGSVPYQLGPEGIIVEEGNAKQLHEKLQWMIDNPQEGKTLGNKMFERAKHYSVDNLNELFYYTIKDIIEGRFDIQKVDMALWESRR